MTPPQAPTAQPAEHDRIYAEFSQTGAVDPSALHKEAQSLAGLAEPGPASKQVSVDDYSDDHVLLCTDERTLTMKRWLLSHPLLVIPLARIVYVLPARVAAPGAGCSAWGTAGGGTIGWARDIHRLGPAGRAYEHSYVCKYREPVMGLRVGFTLSDPERFLYTLEKLEPGVHTKVGLPNELEYVPVAEPGQGEGLKTQ